MKKVKKFQDLKKIFIKKINFNKIFNKLEKILSGFFEKKVKKV